MSYRHSGPSMALSCALVLGLSSLVPLAAQDSLECGAIVTGTLDVNETRAWIFEAEAGDRVEIVLRGASGGFLATCDVFDPSFVPLVDDASGLVAISIESSGTHTVRVQDNDRLHGGAYWLGIEWASPESSACAEGDLTCGDLVEQTIDSTGDVDRFYIPASAGDFVSFALRGASGGFLALADLIAPDGSVVVAGWMGRIDTVLEQDGRYGVRVRDNDYWHTGTYWLGVEWIEPDEARCGRAADLVCGGVAEGSLTSPGAQDIATFEAAPGDVVTLTLRGASGGFLALGDLISPDGDILVSGVSGRRDVPLEEGGRYTLRVYDNDLWHTGTYWLGIEWAAPVESQCSGAPLLACGDIVEREIEGPAEHDVWQFEGRANDRVVIDLRGASGGFLAQFDLLASDGTLLESARSSATVVTLPEDGLYGLRVYDNDLWHGGRYWLGLEWLAPFPSRCSEEAPLECGDVVTRSLDVPAEADVFDFDGEAGEIVTISLRGASGGFLAVAQLVDSDGVSVASDIVGRRDVLLPRDGHYSLWVTDNDHWHAGTYALGLERWSLDRICPDGPELLCGQNLRGSIDSSADQEIYTFAGEEGQIVTLSLLGASGGFLSRFDVLAPSGEAIALAAGLVEDVVLPETGDYRVRIYDNDLWHSGAWSLSFSRLAPFCDCNGNDRPDDLDVSLGASTDDDDDGVPDECRVTTNPWFVRADANQDAGVDVSDAVGVLIFLFEDVDAELPCEKAADANDDGFLDISDAVYILRWLFSGGAEPPEPRASCGVDPTPDTLTCVSFAGCG